MTDDAEEPVKGAAPVPLPTGDCPTFDAPWQARAFGLAVALFRESDHYEWSDFQRRLVEGVDDTKWGNIASIEATAVDRAREDIEANYYDRWLTTLERLLVETGDVTPEALVERATEFAAESRTAAEFVEGDREH